MSSALRERGTVEAATRPQLSLVPRPRRLPGPKIVLAGIYLLAVAYHWLQSRAHVSPAVFGDELLYSKLAQSLAAGDGFTVRGEPVFFPAPLAVVFQAPAWLIDSVPDAYALVKALNTVLMSAAVFPAYWLARRVARPSFALVAAAAAVAGPPMLYGPYLMSEALAYPVFLVALATMLRAIERPSGRWEAAVVGVSVAAVLTRMQFVVLPIAYLLAAPAAGLLSGDSLRVALRRHRMSLGALALFVALPALTGGVVLGSYAGAAMLGYEVKSVLSWTGFTAALLPFAAGFLVVPGAILGLGVSLLRPRTRTEAGFGALVLATGVLILLEAGLIAAGEAERALERYTIYLVPLVFIAFFAYAERGAPGRRLYVALAIAGAATAWLMPFPARAGTIFTFDTPTFSVYAQLARWWGHANAATIFAAVPLFGGAAIAIVGLRRTAAALGVGVATLVVLVAAGIPAYAGDHELTGGTLKYRAGSPPDWLDRSGLGPADYLQLPGGSAHYGWLLETWNRDFGRPIRLGVPTGDGYATSTARIAPDGRLLIDGQPLRPGLLVVNDFAAQLELEGVVVARPLDGLTAIRVPANARAGSLASGLMFDGWASGVTRYQVWSRTPGRLGVYRVRFELPRGHEPRKATLSVDGGVSKTIDVLPGRPRTVELPVPGHPVPVLRIEVDRSHVIGAGTANARLVAVRITDLSYRTQEAPRNRR
jgi:hypothetical protein